MQEDKMKQYLECVERFLPQYLLDCEFVPETINSAMAYSYLSGGKRLRPILVLAVSDILRPGASKLEAVQSYAAALEMIHNYSLIHDDLPAMDDDDLRRGQPSNHMVYGEAMAILAGDALLNRAFEIMPMPDDNVKEICAENILDAWKNLAVLAGESGMIGGQVMDLEAEGKAVDLNYLETLQSLKTSGLLRAAVVGPAKLLNLDKEVIQALDEFGLYLGRVFQIQDDILDVEAQENELGKTVGKDAEQEKATYVTILGIDRAKEKLLEVEKICSASLETLVNLDYDISFLSEVLIKLSKRRY